MKLPHVRVEDVTMVEFLTAKVAAESGRLSATIGQVALQVMLVFVVFEAELAGIPS